MYKLYDYGTAITIILVLGIMMWVGNANRIDNYISSHPEMPKIQQQAMREGVVLQGMAREQVEVVWGKGKTYSIQGTLAYKYYSKFMGKETTWYIIYDENDMVLWANGSEANYDIFPSQKQGDITKSEYMLQQMQLKELEMSDPRYKK